MAMPTRNHTLEYKKRWLMVGASLSLVGKRTLMPINLPKSFSKKSGCCFKSKPEPFGADVASQ